MQKCKGLGERSRDNFLSLTETVRSGEPLREAGLRHDLGRGGAGGSSGYQGTIPEDSSRYSLSLSSLNSAFPDSILIVIQLWLLWLLKTLQLYGKENRVCFGSLFGRCKGEGSNP